jgi:sporulation protein YlmC with PRC-barrel domain
MELIKGQDIITPDGDKVGSIERVVLDPKTKEVSHIVIEKGFLLTERKVVPISMLGAETEDGIVLREAEYLDDLAPFRETEYVSAGLETPETRERGEKQPVEKAREYPSEFAPRYYWYPPVGVGWWRGLVTPTYVEPEYVRTVEFNIPKGTVALEEGAAVITSDDKHIGNVEEILTDPQENRATHFVISTGTLL